MIIIVPRHGTTLLLSFGVAKCRIYVIAMVERSHEIRKTIVKNIHNYLLGSCRREWAFSFKGLEGEEEELASEAMDQSTCDYKVQFPLLLRCFL